MIDHPNTSGFHYLYFPFSGKNMSTSMASLVEGFPGQLKDAQSVPMLHGSWPSAEGISSALVCGLGGSGIGGTILSNLCASHSKIPVNVSKEYGLPSYAGKDTLLIISSYSGNTEETLASLEEAIKRKCRIVCISSGGKVEALAKQHALPCLVVPGGMPPRACLGFSLVQLLRIAVHYHLLPENVLKELNAGISLIQKEKEQIQKDARSLASFLLNKYPILYSTGPWEGVSIRFRQQLNENAKILCSHHVVPEMNHNELVGWTSRDEKLAVVLLKDPKEYERNTLRFELLEQVIRKYTPHLVSLHAKGDSAVEKSMYLIHLCDWASVYLAELRGVDAIEVKVIDHLKTELGKR